MINPLASDLNHILSHTEDLWEELRGQRIFVTGGTGFFGAWLLESFAWANAHFNLKASLVVLTRDVEAFRKKTPRLANDHAIGFHVGDIRNYRFPEGEFSHIIHAATTSAVATFNKEDPLVKFDTVVQGTRHTLDFAVRCHAKKLLITSSGAVYGVQPPNMTHIPEDYRGSPDPADSGAALGEGKRTAEFLGTYYSGKYGIETKIARCFSFVGPYLPLDIHYAIGNFIRDGMKGDPILVKGDGTVYRSYLYAADLVIWLWTILLRGKACYPYNVGSEDHITMAELAHTVSQCFQKPIEVQIAKTPDPVQPVERYVPLTKRAQEELGLRQRIDLPEGIKRTISFFQNAT